MTDERIEAGFSKSRASIRLTRRRFVAALPVSLMAPDARATDLFLLDQTHGSIVFSVEHFGTFSSKGTFPRFSGRLAIDRARPEATTIDVTADVAAVSIPWPDGAALLRSPEFFDVEKFPFVRFVSGKISGLDPSRFRIDGTLEIRGIQRPLVLEAKLIRAAPDPAKGTEVAHFSVNGELSRAAYGMVAQPLAISDTVRLSIAARIDLPAERK